MSSDYQYPGKELSLFEEATNWKRYLSGSVRPYLRGRVLEVGAGTGNTTRMLNDGSSDEWTLLEPDGNLFAVLQHRYTAGEVPGNCRLHEGTIDSLPVTEKFDCILYIDVLEHIEDDKTEIEKAFALLNKGGTLIILSPAFPFLFSPFDKEIGHYRRYTKKMLAGVTGNPALAEGRLRYLDSMGFMASAANRLLLRQSYPTQVQVSIWDKWMVPVSRIMDRIFFFSFGKSILGIWKKI